MCIATSACAIRTIMSVEIVIGVSLEVRSCKGQSDGVQRVGTEVIVVAKST